MGAPIADFVVATNANDILTRFVNDGDMSIAEVVPTLSPSMDIQVSSNFERMLWVMNDGDGPRTAEQLQRFRQSGRLDVDDETRARWINGAFRAVAGDRRRGHRRDPPRPRRDRRARSTRTRRRRTLAARRLAGGHPVVTMATAHPAKFPDAVERATGVRPQLPAHLADLFERPERTDVVANDLAAVEDLRHACRRRRRRECLRRPDLADILVFAWIARYHPVSTFPPNVLHRVRFNEGRQHRSVTGIFFSTPTVSGPHPPRGRGNSWPQRHSNSPSWNPRTKTSCWRSPRHWA